MTLKLKLGGAIAALALTTTGAFAQDFPEKPIELIVPYGAGGLTDSFARALAKAAEAHLPVSQPIVVVNKPGGGGTIGLTAAFTAEPDGHTITFLTSSPLVIQPLYGRTAFKADDFQPIIRTYDIPAALNVHTGSEWKNFDQWLEGGKAHPGEFTYGTSGGTGSGGHIATEQLADALGVELRHVPFEGSAPLMAALMGGQIMGSNQLPDIHNDGELFPVIFTTPTKPDNAVYDDVPTTRSAGIDAEVVFFSGIVGNKNIPADRIQILHDAFKAAMDDATVQDLFVKYQLTPSYAGPEEFGEIIAKSVASNAVTMKRLGLIE